MKIQLETRCADQYDEIEKEYGSVLHKFGLTKADDGFAYLSIDRLEDLFELDKEIHNFNDERDDWHVYFGMIIRYENGQPLLIIKDNYD
jgi:hypothetical protein